jgi:Asp-tRNA(Asn)/Glu-tRNA(Gln) amidotransferase A subunit family amidase
LKKKLRIGYFYQTPLLSSSTAVKRAVTLAKENLEKLGHELVPFNFNQEDLIECQDIYFKSVSIGLLG